MNTNEYWTEIHANISNTETNTLRDMLETLEQFRNETTEDKPFEDECEVIRSTRIIIRRELIERWKFDSQFDNRFERYAGC
jgi:hypothetical protein